MFKEYPKIYHLGTEDVEGILDCEFNVYEKLDGANVSIWMEDGHIQLASKSQPLKMGDDFRGFRSYVDSNEGLHRLLKQHPNIRLYGEWLVKHTVIYPPERLNRLYLLDFYIDDKKYIASKEFFDIYELDVAPCLYTNLKGLSKDDLQKMLDSIDGIEGFVIKSKEFKNSWGHNLYAKLVKPEFKEIIQHNKKMKNNTTIDESWIVDKYCTSARINKMLALALQNYPLELQNDDHSSIITLGDKNIKIIGNLLYRDILSEGILDISKHLKTLNFRVLLGCICKRLYTEGFR